MGKSKVSESRQYLQYLANKLEDLKAKKAALSVHYEPIVKEHDGLIKTITSVKHQIKREERLENITGIETAGPAKIKYEVAVPKFKEVEVTEDTSETTQPEAPASESKNK